MNKPKLAVVAGSLAAGVAASALALMVAGTVGMMMLSQSAENSAQFSTSAFLGQANAWMWAAMLGSGLVVFGACLLHKKK